MGNISMAFGLPSISNIFGAGKNKKGSGNSFIGLDFGSSAIKLVQIKIEKDIPTLETYGELQLGPYENTDVGRTTHLTNTKHIEALNDLLRESSAAGQKVAYAISYNNSYTNVIPIPTLEQEKIASMLPVEARKYIPISLSQVEIDWIPVGIDEGEKTTSVMLTAVYKDAIARYKDVVTGAGLTPLNTEIEIFSTVRSVVSPEDTGVAVIDLGASSTRLYIVDNGTVQKTHSVLLSGVGLTSALQEVLEGTFENAEETKRTYGLHGKEGDSKILKTVVDNVERGFRELHTVMTRYETNEGKKINKIILTGGGAELRGLPEYAKDMFSRPVSLAHPFSKVAYPVFLEDTVKDVGPSLAVALGMALQLALES